MENIKKNVSLEFNGKLVTDKGDQFVCWKEYFDTVEQAKALMKKVEENSFIFSVGAEMGYVEKVLLGTDLNDRNKIKYVQFEPNEEEQLEEKTYLNFQWAPQRAL